MANVLSSAPLLVKYSTNFHACFFSSSDSCLKNFAKPGRATLVLEKWAACKIHDPKRMLSMLSLNNHFWSRIGGTNHVHVNETCMHLSINLAPDLILADLCHQICSFVRIWNKIAGTSILLIVAPSRCMIPYVKDNKWPILFCSEIDITQLYCRMNQSVFWNYQTNPDSKMSFLTRSSRFLISVAGFKRSSQCNWLYESTSRQASALPRRTLLIFSIHKFMGQYDICY